MKELMKERNECTKKATTLLAVPSDNKSLLPTSKALAFWSPMLSQ